MNKQGVIYTNDKDKTDILHAYFSDQTSLDESNASLSSVAFDNTNILDTFHFTPNKVEEISKNRDSS